MSAMAVALGEPAQLQRPSAVAVVALAYLTGPVALGGWVVFVWLLGRLPAATVSTYAYVNPVVALVVGWALLGERITGPTIVGALLILVAVAFVLARGTSSPRAARRAAAGIRRTGRRCSVHPNGARDMRAVDCPSCGAPRLWEHRRLRRRSRRPGTGEAARSRDPAMLQRER